MYLKFNKMNITVDQFHKTCRACLFQGNVCNLFNAIYQDLTFAEHFKNMSSIQVNINDDLPINICEQCIGVVVKFADFIKSVHESDLILKRLVLHHKKNCVKEEFQNENCTNLDSEISSFDIKNVDVIENIHEGQPSFTLVECGNIKEVIHLEMINECKKELMPESNNYNDIKAPLLQNLKPISGRKIKPKLEFFVCSYCKATFNSQVEYKLHRDKERGKRIKNRFCTICQKPFSTSQLKLHMFTHTKEKPFNCNVCSESFTCNGNLRRHMMRHTGERPHVCEICGKGFIQGPSLRDHLKLHTNSKSFICSKCGKKYASTASLKIHMRVHEIEKAKQKDNSYKYIPKNSVQCDVCEKLFATKSILANHKQLHGEKRFLCSECGKKFSLKALLQSHLKTHTGSRPFVCEICNKAFSQRSTLQSHILTHTGEKPFACKVCEKRFKQGSHLRYHMRIHNNERPYTCTFCQKSFRHSGTLTVHTRTHTGETPFSCDICSQGFYDSSSMKKHRRKHLDISNKLKSETKDEILD